MVFFCKISAQPPWKHRHLYCVRVCDWLGCAANAHMHTHPLKLSESFRRCGGFEAADRKIDASSSSCLHFPPHRNSTCSFVTKIKPEALEAPLKFRLFLFNSFWFFFFLNKSVYRATPQSSWCVSWLKGLPRRCSGLFWWLLLTWCSTVSRLLPSSIF